MTVRPLPADDDTCGWVQLLPERAPSPPLRGEQMADWAVIGAGYTGLAAARRLAELAPGQRVVVVEAARVGSGPSGRNSGFVIDLPHNVDSRDVEEVEANRRVKRLNQAALAELRALVERHGIDCDWSEIGKIHGAVRPVGERALEALARALDRLGERYELLDGARLEGVLGTRYYTLGLRTAGCVLVQPAALIRGLAGALPGSVELFERSPVTSLARAGGGWRLATPRGAVRAPRVILATDAFTRSFGLLRSQLVPVYTYASLTRPLSPEEVGGAREWALLPAHKAGSTIRRLKSGRILVRNSFRYGGDHRCTAEHLARARRPHVASLHARYPALPSIDVEWTWGGVVCFTRNFVPFFGRLEDGLFAAVGTNGVGIAKGTIAGRLIADLALDARSDLLADMEAYPAPARNPLGPLLGLAVSARLTWEALRAGAES